LILADAAPLASRARSVTVSASRRNASAPAVIRKVTLDRFADRLAWSIAAPLWSGSDTGQIAR
jgi:hypothetical protein